jgi:hypothetical protein
MIPIEPGAAPEAFDAWGAVADLGSEIRRAEASCSAASFGPPRGRREALAPGGGALPRSSALPGIDPAQAPFRLAVHGVLN